MLPVGNIPQGWPGNHASQIKNKYSDPFLGNERDMPVCQQPVRLIEATYDGIRFQEVTKNRSLENDNVFFGMDYRIVRLRNK
jgi:hypothetical protein